MGKKYVIIHDLEDNLDQALLKNPPEEYQIIESKNKSARCIGCFKCWLKTPGVCGFQDRFEHLGEEVFRSEKLIIISEMLYGGLSIVNKRVVDRMIPGITPFFKKREENLHHLERYKTRMEITVVFYHAKQATEPEKITSEAYARAMALDFHAKSCEVIYIEEGLQEVRL